MNCLLMNWEVADCASNWLRGFNNDEPCNKANLVTFPFLSAIISKNFPTPKSHFPYKKLHSIINVPSSDPSSQNISRK